MASSSILETIGFEIQTKDIRNPLKRVSFLFVYFLVMVRGALEKWQQLPTIASAV